MPVRWNDSKLLSEVDAKARRGLEKAALFLVRQIKLSLRGGQPAGAKGKPPHRLTGALARSIDYELVGKYAARIGSNLVYARIHELGGVIRPKKAKALRFRVGKDWVMVKRVDIPKRPYLRPALDKKSNRLEIARLVATG